MIEFQDINKVKFYTESKVVLGYTVYAMIQGQFRGIVCIQKTPGNYAADEAATKAGGYIPRRGLLQRSNYLMMAGPLCFINYKNSTVLERNHTNNMTPEKQASTRKS